MTGFRFMTHGPLAGRPAQTRLHPWFHPGVHSEGPGSGYFMKTLIILFMLLAAALILLLFPVATSGSVGGVAGGAVTPCGQGTTEAAMFLPS